MKIKVRVFATLRKHLPDLGIGEAKPVELPEGATFENLRAELNLPLEEIKVIMRNGIQSEMDEIIEDGDRIAYIPAVGGG